MKPPEICGTLKTANLTFSDYKSCIGNLVKYRKV